MRQFVIVGLAAFSLSGCMTVAKTTGKAAALPFKATYFTGKTVGKGVIGTTKMVGKGAYATGKGVYYVGSVPVKITDQAMDTSTKILVMTTQVVDLSGKVFIVSSQFHASQLDSELMKFKRATNVLSVVIDAFA
jgi:hypothetical protein